jgi:ribosomal protein S18 acetylase RimI-like enzyme|tara:strand:- start:3521 stop:3961 length:441 start_codon:yes stop_codon:yes gene_type:complete
MRIVPYKSLYFNRCLSILKSNTPEFIDKSEESLFINYLSRKGIIYFVLFESRKLIGCGGYGYVDKKDSVILSWGLIHNQFHKMGFGTHLFQYRIKHIMKNYPNSNIILDTSQKTYKFYERFSFKVDNITRNFYGKGLDRYDMSYIQ